MNKLALLGLGTLVAAVTLTASGCSDDSDDGGTSGTGGTAGTGGSGTGGTGGGTGGTGGGTGGAGGMAGGGGSFDAAAFCADFGTTCTFSADTFADAAACQSAVGAFTAARQTCITQHIDFAKNTGDTATHCPHAAGKASPCDA